MVFLCGTTAGTVDDRIEAQRTSSAEKALDQKNKGGRAMVGSWSNLASACAAVCAVVTAVHAQGTAPAQDEKGAWVRKSPMAAAINEVALAAGGDKVHVLGGGVLGVAGPYHQEYDTRTDRWRARANLPRGLDHIGTAVVGGRIFTVGG